ncbi:hypothetical protein N802_06850 [Knoellia sinensis KCTC 19936]|uniref:Uncharacterized protein n=1 Tax=Knoellia sinensis KCTC 19936 TaxID=1385520 RepID=A0A0A0J1H4_9MICO|nr:PD-(D/E)XK nuclease family protein [Knoellia sinensis]KGN30529.1 hypothetical protein N802_06850 [Knoellia sinensis KCTC 19936]
MNVIASTDRVVLIKVPKTADTASSNEQLYEATRKWWKVAAARRDGSEQSPTHALAVLANHVVAAFTIDRWEGPDNAGRWAFVGEMDSRMSRRYKAVDVSAYFPKGAQNPVRYVNCPPPAVIERPSDSKADHTDFERALELLDQEPLAAIMMGQRELFHSNFIAWYFRHFPREADSIFHSGPNHGTGSKDREVLREYLNIDVWMDWANGSSMAIENKVFALPDRKQLSEYATKIQSRRPGARMILLSLLNPQWEYDTLETRDGIWDYWSYARLATHLRECHIGRAEYASQIVLHYADMVDALATVVSTCTTVSADEPLDLPNELAERISSTQLRATLRKMRTRQVAARLQHDLAGFLDTDVAVGSSFGTAGPIVTGWIPLDVPNPTSPWVGFQFQGDQFRRVAVLPHLDTRKGGSAAARQEWAQHNERLFEFSKDLQAELGATGPVMPSGPGAFNKYEPDFVYRYVKTPGLTYRQLFAAASTVISTLLAHQLGGTQ